MHADDPTCYLCTGKDCRRAKGHHKLGRALAATDATVVEVRCQKVCHGPVVGIEVDGALEWFERVRKPGARAAVGELVDAGGDGIRRPGSLPHRLAKRRVPERSGRLRT